MILFFVRYCEGMRVHMAVIYVGVCIYRYIICVYVRILCVYVDV